MFPGRPEGHGGFRQDLIVTSDPLGLPDDSVEITDHPGEITDDSGEITDDSVELTDDSLRTTDLPTAESAQINPLHEVALGEKEQHDCGEDMNEGCCHQLVGFAAVAVLKHP